jgi:hypothetical protein
MFVLGLLVGIVITLVLVIWAYAWFSGHEQLPLSFTARSAIRDLERQTIHDMLRTEWQAGARTPAPGTDIVEGTASEVEPS